MTTIEDQDTDAAYRLGFHHAAVAAYRLALDGAAPEDFGRWTAVVLEWRDDPEAGPLPPTVRPAGERPRRVT